MEHTIHAEIAACQSHRESHRELVHQFQPSRPLHQNAGCSTELQEMRHGPRPPGGPEAALDAIALFAELFIVPALLFAAPSGRDDSFCLHAFDMRQDAVAVIALVGDSSLGPPTSEQFDRLGAVVHLAGGDAEVDRLALLVGEQVDPGRQTSSGTPQSLVRAHFLRPVAAC